MAHQKKIRCRNVKTGTIRHLIPRLANDKQFMIENGWVIAESIQDKPVALHKTPAAPEPAHKPEPEAEDLPDSPQEEEDEDLTEFNGLNAKQMASRVKGMNNKRALKALYDQENERAKPRKTVIDAIDERFENLK